MATWAWKEGGIFWAELLDVKLVTPLLEAFDASTIV